MAASDLVATITDKDVGRLGRLFRPFTRGSARIDAKSYATADRRFHRFVLQACRNDLDRVLCDGESKTIATFFLCELCGLA